MHRPRHLPYGYLTLRAYLPELYIGARQDAFSSCTCLCYARGSSLGSRSPRSSLPPSSPDRAGGKVRVVPARRYMKY